MPRRNHERQAPPPLSITPQDIPRVKPVRTIDEIAADKAASERRHRLREESNRRRRVAAAVDWHMCCIPGCETKLRASYDRDVDARLPICTLHAVIIKRQIDTDWDDEGVIAVRLERQALAEQKRDGYHRARNIDENGGQSKGQMYFLRLNGLIKVGWSGDLIKRLKAYGPEVVVLCHYPASRQDETLMHRQLRPFLAKGREWYQDCKLIEDTVANLVKQYGQPHLSAFWTEPKPDVIRLRNRSA